VTIERIDIVITEKGGKVVKRSLDDIADSAKKVDTDLTKMNKTAMVVGGAVGAALGGLAVVLFNGFKNAAQSIKETASASKQLGIGVENLSRLDFAAKSADLTTKDLVSTIQILQRTQAQAAKPNSEMNKLFGQLGISATDASGKLRNTEAVLRDVADIFKRMPDGTNKSTLALKLFGAENQNVIGLLNDGSQGLDEMAKKSDELGYTLSGETAKGVKEFYDELDSVKLQIEAMYRQALPGLLPQLKEFSNLLNSEEFKSGFNAIIQGAAQAIIWLTKFMSTVGNVTKFLGEEVAARANGPMATDVVRVEERIERLQDTMKALQNVEKTAGFSVFGAKELVPSDLLKSRDEVLKRLQGEMDMEKNKLQIGMQLNAEDIKRTQEAAAAAAAEMGKPPTGGGPDIDWTKLGRTPASPKGPDPAKELERLQRQLNSTLSAITPVLNAQQDLIRAQDVFDKSIAKGLVTQQEANDYMKLYEEQLRDALDPLGALSRQLDDQIHLAGLLNDEREVETQMLNIGEQLKRQGIRTTEEQNAGLREQLKLLQETDKLGAAKEGFLGQSRGKRDENFGIDAKALGELVGSGDVAGADKFNIVNQLLGGTLDDTQEAFEAQLEQFQEYYARVAELRAADVLSAQEASNAMVAIKRAELEMNLARTEQALGAAAGLMQSNSKEAFRVGQAAAIGQAIVNTYTGATAAYQSAAAIPYVGWILGPVAAAGAIAAGMAQVSAIRSQQMPAYRTGGTYTVGGMGGTDSQTVAFRATPGEQVNINTPAQARAMERMATMAERGEAGSGPRSVTQNVTIVQQGKADRRTSAQQARDLRKATQRQFERT
jgi:hypothetical protein